MIFFFFYLKSWIVREQCSFLVQIRWIKPCSLFNPVDIKRKSCSHVISLSKPLNGSETSGPALHPGRGRTAEHFPNVGG